MDEKKAPSLFDRARSVASAVTGVPLADRLHGAVNGLLDPSGQREIKNEAKEEARSAAELLTTATNKPEQIVEQAKARVAIVEDASTQLQAMVADTATTPDLNKVKAIVSTAEAAVKALDAQETALKSAQEAFDKSNPNLSKTEAVPDAAKTKEISEVTAIVDAGDKAMAAIAPARQILYDMWVQDCKEVADVIAGKKKPTDIKQPVVHTLMGALDAYSKDKEKFKLDDTQKKALDAVVLSVSLVIDKDAAVKDRFTFDEAKYNDARAKKAVIDRDSAPVEPRADQKAKVAQKEKLDKAIAAVADEKRKLGEAQQEVEEKRKELVGRVEKDATAAFDKVQKMITQLGIDAQKTAPGEALSADVKRTRHADVSEPWEEAMKKFKDVDPVKAKLVTENLAKLAEQLFPEQDKSGKKPAFSRLNFRSMYDNLAKNIGKTKAGKFVGGAINRVRSGLDTYVRKLNGGDVAEVVAEVKTENDAREWVDRITDKVRLIHSDKQAPYWTVPQEMRDTYEELLKSEGESIYSEADQDKLIFLTEVCGRANDKLEAYNTHHKELEELLEKAEKYIEKAKEIALRINIQKIEAMITELAEKPNEGEEDKKARLTDYSEITESWSELIKTLDYMSQDQIDAVNAKIADLSKALFPAPAAGKEAGKKNNRHSILEWPGLIRGWFARKGEAAKGNKPAELAKAEVDPQNEAEARQRLKDLGTAEEAFIQRVNNALSALSIDKVEDFNAQLGTLGLYSNGDRNKFYQLLDLCENAQDVVGTYIANRKDLEALLEKVRAYAEKAEAIAQKLNTERRDSGMPTPEISDGDIQSWFARVNIDLIAAKDQYDNALSEINTDHPQLYSSFYDKLEALDNSPRYRVGEGDVWTEARRLLNEFKTSDGTPADNLKKYREVHEQLNDLILRIKDYIAAVEAIKDTLIQEHSSKKGEVGAASRVAEQSERDKPADNAEVQSFVDSVDERILSLRSKVKYIRDALPEAELLTLGPAYSRAADLFKQVVDNYIVIYYRLKGLVKSPITVTMLRDAKTRIPELIAQCEGPINTTYENVKKKPSQ